VPHIASEPRHLVGQVVGNGHCVGYVRAAAQLPRSGLWLRGVPVRGAKCEVGTAIATFTPKGLYGSRTDGSSHCAILVAETDNGLIVLDQWVGQPVHERLIRFRDHRGTAVNDGDRYHTIEVRE